jgi:flagellar hook-basal body complex protein FliE
MDGLTISNADALLEKGQTLSGMNRARISGDLKAPEMPDVSGDTKAEKSFAATLKDAVNHVNALQQASDVKMQELATGKTKDISEVMITAERADIALKLMVQVRNKIINAYEEIMKMQV